MLDRLQFGWIAMAALFLCAPAHGDSALAGLDAALSSNNSQQVRASIRRLLSEDESATTLLRAGALLAGHDLLSDAAAVFEKCSQRFPASFEAKYNLALARIGLNNYSEARNTLDSMTPASAREIAAVAYLRGKVDSATGRPRQARENLEAAYRANPEVENYALDLALLYIRSSDDVPAIQVLQRALARRPASPELELELALADALAGRQADAVAACRKLLRRDPAQSTPRVIAAFAHCMRGNYQACETEASAGLSQPHANPYLFYLRAEARWNSGSKEPAKMLTDLTAALGAMPTCSVCLLLRSKVFEASDDDRAAAGDLKAALAQDPQLAPAWYRLSVLYRKAGQIPDAEDAIRHYRSIHERQVNGEIENFRKQLLGSIDNQNP